jgi:hypothetical protein
MFPLHYTTNMVEEIKAMPGKKKNSGKVIFRPWITRNGKRIYASQYGLKAFPIRVKSTGKK